MYILQVDPQYSSPDLKTLRERLLKNVEKMNTEVQSQKQKPKKKTMFDDRLYLTNNYVIDSNLYKEVSIVLTNIFKRDFVHLNPIILFIFPCEII